MPIADSPEESKLRLADIKQAAGIPEDCHDDVVSVPKKHHGEGVWRDLLLRPTPAVRHILICGVGIHFFQQASGIDSVVLYSPDIFENAGIKKDTDNLLATMAVGFTKTMFILVATFMLDKIGRRPLLLSSVAGMILSPVGLGTGLTVISNSEHKTDLGHSFVYRLGFNLCVPFLDRDGPDYMGLQFGDFPLKVEGPRVQYWSGGESGHQWSDFHDIFILEQRYHHWRGILFVCRNRVRRMGVLLHFIPRDSREDVGEMELLFGTFFQWRRTAAVTRALKEKKREGN